MLRPETHAVFLPPYTPAEHVVTLQLSRLTPLLVNCALYCTCSAISGAFRGAGKGSMDGIAPPSLPLEFLNTALCTSCMCKDEGCPIPLPTQEAENGSSASSDSGNATLGADGDSRRPSIQTSTNGMENGPSMPK